VALSTNICASGGATGVDDGGGPPVTPEINTAMPHPGPLVRLLPRRQEQLQVRPMPWEVNTYRGVVRKL
jgi:hypothetical protein